MYGAQPLIRNYAGAEIHHPGTIWSFAEAPDGTLFAGTNEGLLHYNGVSWRLTPAPGRAVRCLKYVAGDRLYFGSANDFGWITYNTSGEVIFNSLSGLLPDSVSMRSVFGIVATSTAIYFETQLFVVKYEPASDSLTIIHPGGFVESLLEYKGNLFGSTGDGLIEISPEGVIRSKDTRQGVFKGLIVDMLALSDGSLLGISDEYELLRIANLEKGIVEPWNAPASRLPDVQYYIDNYVSLLLRDVFGEPVVVLSTTGSGILLVSETGNVLMHLTTADGLLSNHVYTSFVDSNKNLWIGSPEGISKVMLNIPYQIFGTQDGLSLPVRAVLYQNGLLYAGTESGLSVKSSADKHFKPLSTFKSQVWQLVPWRDGLLAAGGNEGAWFVQGKRVRPYKTPVATMAVQPLNDQFFLTGLFSGLALYQYENEGNAQLVQLFSGISSDCRSIAIGPDSSVWVGTRYDGIFRFSLKELLRAPAKTPVVSWYGRTNGLKDATFTHVVVHNETVLATDAKGMYRFNHAGNHFADTVMTGFQQVAFPRLKKDQTEGIWLLNTGTLLRNNGVDSLSLRAVNGQILDIHRYGDSTFAASSNGLYVHTQKALSNVKQLPLQLRLSVAGKPEYTRSESDKPLPLSWNERDVTFTFASPYFILEELTQYEYQLSGLEKTWKTASSGTVRYIALQAGTYTFRVAARNAVGGASEMAAISIRILPPWYRSPAMILVYLIALIVLVWVIITYYSAALRRRNEELEQLVDKRTSELASKKQALEKRTEELQAANDVKTKFIHMAIHDMRNPLGVATGYAELLLESHKEQAGSKEVLERMLKVLSNMSTRVTELLQSNREATPLESVPIHVMTEEVVSEARVLASKKMQVIDVAIETEGYIHGIRSELHEALLNVVENAVKFSPVSARIWIQLQKVSSANEQDSLLRIAVHDEGPGIPVSDHENMFKPYSVLSAKPTAGELSTGLGLSIVKEIVERHGGRIWFNSNPNLRKGTTFYIDLPGTLTSAEVS
jgi:signal transduction histidine kinase